MALYKTEKHPDQADPIELLDFTDEVQPDVVWETAGTITAKDGSIITAWRPVTTTVETPAYAGPDAEADRDSQEF